MDRSPSDRILDEWDAVAHTVRLPADAPRRRAVRGSFGPMSLVPLVAGALVVAVGITWLAGREGPQIGADGSPGPSAAQSDGAVASTAPSTAPSEETQPPADCRADLSATIRSWEGAAGSRIATVEVANRGSQACSIPAIARPALVDGSGTGLAVGGAAIGPATIEIPPGDHVSTLVQVANVCFPQVIAPVTIVFDFGDGSGVGAAPLTPTDVTVPPCNGPGRPASIEMQPWSR